MGPSCQMVFLLLLLHICYVASKAVDLLMESKWTNEPKSNDPDQPYFINRTYAVDYCRKLVYSYLVCVQSIGYCVPIGVGGGYYKGIPSLVTYPVYG